MNDKTNVEEHTYDEWHGIAVEAKAGRYRGRKPWWNAFEPPSPIERNLIQQFMHELDGLFNNMEDADDSWFDYTKGMCGDLNIWTGGITTHRLLTVDHSDDTITVTHWFGQRMIAMKHLVITGPSAGKLMICDIGKGTTSVEPFEVTSDTKTLVGLTLLGGVDKTPTLEALHSTLDCLINIARLQ